MINPENYLPERNRRCLISYFIVVLLGGCWKTPIYPANGGIILIPRHCGPACGGIRLIPRDFVPPLAG
jgi:hypothetical protein